MKNNYTYSKSGPKRPTHPTRQYNTLGSDDMDMRCIVHGGAIGVPDEPTNRQLALDSAARAATARDSPVEAVRAALRVLESDPQFNAGLGSSVQADGYIRTDAGLMTADGSVGAACSMPGVEHAIDVAEIVRRETPHILISGVHAVDIAEAYGIETGVDLWTAETRNRWEDVDDLPPTDPREQATWVNERFGHGHDTVGAVATDGDRVAAATSTGGRWLALAGRVGDVPQVGSGFYCTDSGGVSATGAGEDIARRTLSRRAIDLLEEGHHPEEAAELAIDEFSDAVNGAAGLILLTPDGRSGSAFNSESMMTSIDGTVG